MANATNVLNSLVPITQFNWGQAARIFDRLHSESQLVVLKNNQPAAVILSQAKYQRLSEIEGNLFAASGSDEATGDLHRHHTD